MGEYLRTVQSSLYYRYPEPYTISDSNDTMDVEDAAVLPSASIKKALIIPLRDRFKVEVANGPEMEVQGNIMRHEYSIEAGGGKVAEVSKKMVPNKGYIWNGNFGVEISPGQNAALILAITVALDQMAHD